MKIEQDYITDCLGNKVCLRHVVILHEYEGFIYLELDDFKTIKKLKGTLKEYNELEYKFWSYV